MAILYDVSWADYLAMPQMNPSTLKHGLKSMKRLQRAIDGECQPDRKTVAVGNATHAILAGELEDRFAVMPAYELHTDNCTAAGKPSTSKSTSYYKDMSALWREENAELEELTEVQLHTAAKVANLIRKRAGDIIDRSKQEVVITGQIGDLEMKTRLDGLMLLDAQTAMVWDVKTTSDVSTDAFARIFLRLGYGFSASVHVELLRQNGFEVNDYRIIAAEVDGDYDVRVLHVPYSVWENGLTRVEKVVDQYVTALVNDDWPGLPDGPLVLPNWSMEQDEEEEDELDWADTGEVA